MTPIDQVAARRPRTLLVNIGSNEGLFHAAFSGAFDPQTLQSVADIPAKMIDLAEALRALPTEVETIVFNSLIRPRTAPNLMTRGDFPAPTGDDYFDEYLPRIGGQFEIPGSVVRSFDELIARVNDEVKDLMRSKLGSRLRWVDLYALSTRFDGKHYADRFVEVQPDGSFHRLRNVPIVSAFGALHAGGLTGLDNMHPSVPGYALIADEVLSALGAGVVTDKDASFKNDSLLNNLPFAWLISELEFGLLGSFGVFAGDDGLIA